MSEAEAAAVPVDWDEGLARAGDDVDFFKELIELFLEDVPNRLQALEDALAAGSAAEAAAAAHSIKGAAANLSATAVRDRAYELEQRARGDDLDGIEPGVEALKQEVMRLEAFARSL